MVFAYHKTRESAYYSTRTANATSSICMLVRLRASKLQTRHHLENTLSQRKHLFIDPHACKLLKSPSNIIQAHLAREIRPVAPLAEIGVVRFDVVIVLSEIMFSYRIGKVDIRDACTRKGTKTHALPRQISLLRVLVQCSMNFGRRSCHIACHCCYFLPRNSSARRRFPPLVGLSIAD